MIDLLAARYGLAPVDAYMLCSVCGDLRISEIVDHAELGGVVLLPAGGAGVSGSGAELIDVIPAKAGTQNRCRITRTRGGTGSPLSRG